MPFPILCLPKRYKPAQAGNNKEVYMEQGERFIAWDGRACTTVAALAGGIGFDTRRLWRKTSKVLWSLDEQQKDFFFPKLKPNVSYFEESNVMVTRAAVPLILSSLAKPQWQHKDGLEFLADFERFEYQYFREFAKFDLINMDIPPDSDPRAYWVKLALEVMAGSTRHARTLQQNIESLWYATKYENICTNFLDSQDGKKKEDKQTDYPAWVLIQSRNIPEC